MKTKKERPFRESVGLRLMFARKRAGIDQKKAGKAAGVKQAAVSLWERGVNQVPLDKLKVLGDLYGVKPSWFLEGTDLNAEIPF